MKVINTKRLIEIIDVMSNFSIEVVYENGIIYTISDDNVCFLKFDCRNILEDSIQEKIVIDAQQLRLVLKRFKKSSNITIEKEGNNIKIFDGYKKFQLKVLDNDTEKRDLEDKIKYENNPVIVNGDFINTIVKDVLVFANCCVFESKDSKLVVYANENLQSYRAENDVKGELPDFKLKISVCRLEDILPVIKDGDVEMYFQNDMPLKIRTNNCIYIQAPMLIEED